MSRAETRAAHEVLNLSPPETEALLERCKVLSPEDHRRIKAALETLRYLAYKAEANRLTIARLKQFLCVPARPKKDASATTSSSTAASDAVPPATQAPLATPDTSAQTASTTPDAPAQTASTTPDTSAQTASTTPDAPAQTASTTSDTPADASSADEAPARPGHGRNGAADFPGAERCRVNHASLHSGDKCPACGVGRVYPLAEPKVLLRFTASPPVVAHITELERLRCNTCLEIFTARAPPGLDARKYDESVPAMIGWLRYRLGFPHNRLRKVQANAGMPLPASTQWKLVHAAAGFLLPLYHELLRIAALWPLLYNDDTHVKVLEVYEERRQQRLAGEETDERTGCFTSGIVVTNGEHQLILYFTGAQHSGENVQDVLKHRPDELPPPIQMCDALPANTAGKIKTVPAACNSHARRKLVELVELFPTECQHVLAVYRQIYATDKQARGLSDEDRLQLHKDKSKKLMDGLKEWIEIQIKDPKAPRVEPNSPLGVALQYLLNHWDRLTLFLRVPGAPLDNNICERALKMAICHRRNSLFYRTLDGALVGDIFMTLLYSAEQNNVSPTAYVEALLRNKNAVRENPSAWLPWNFHEQTARAAHPVS